MYFMSDNASGAAPQVLEALAKNNGGYARGYGNDPLTERAVAAVRAALEAPEAAVYFVSTGTAANALALATLTQPWQAIFCHRHAHIMDDECNAPEFYSGAKLIGLEGDHGLLSPETLARAIAATGAGGVHGPQRGAVSLTNTTEAGTVYAPEDLSALCAVAHDFALPVHLDGARFANALVGAGATAAEMSWKAGVDVLSFGGTKNGCLGVEAVVFFNPEKAWEFELRRKRGGHLSSKTRFLAAQMLAYLEGGLWLKLAERANGAALALAEGLDALPQARILHPVDANIIFAALPRRSHQRLHEAGAHYYLWPGDQTLDGAPDEMLTCRLVASWCTTDAEVARFLEVAAD